MTCKGHKCITSCWEKILWDGGGHEPPQCLAGPFHLSAFEHKDLAGWAKGQGYGYVTEEVGTRCLCREAAPKSGLGRERLRCRPGPVTRLRYPLL